MLPSAASAAGHRRVVDRHHTVGVHGELPCGVEADPGAVEQVRVAVGGEVLDAVLVVVLT
jgi:hypothetical protein